VGHVKQKRQRRTGPENSPITTQTKKSRESRQREGKPEKKCQGEGKLYGIKGAASHMMRDKAGGVKKWGEAFGGIPQGGERLAL